jgi:hypothetical protein
VITGGFNNIAFPHDLASRPRFATGLHIPRLTIHSICELTIFLFGTVLPKKA